MKRNLIVGCAAVLAAWASHSANAGILITEWMYSGMDGEYIEFTNTGALPVDMTGWSFDDDSRIAGTVSLSSFGIVAAGESVLLIEPADASAFRTAWGLAGSVQIVAGNMANLSRNDEINIYDNLSQLVDRLAYGDQTFVGSIRTQNRSGNPITPAALGANDPYQWELAVNGDAHGSYLSALGDIGNPGTHLVPEPSAALLFVLGAAGLFVHRRARARAIIHHAAIARSGT